MNNIIEGAIQRELEFKKILDKDREYKSILKKKNGVFDLLKNEQDKLPGSLVRLSDVVPAFTDKSRRTAYATLIRPGSEVRIAVLGENEFGLGKLDDNRTISYIPIEDGELEMTIKEAIKTHQ